MIKEAIEKIEQLTKPVSMKIADRNYTSKAVSAVLDPMPAPIMVHTLTGMMDYIKANKDKLDLNEHLIHIEAHETVHLCSKLTGNFLQRPYLIGAYAIVPKFSFGQWVSVEEFIVQIQSMFMSGDDVADILKIVGNLRDEKIATLADDGVTQTANTKVGITRVETVEIPNPVLLAPYRTFLEIEQPESQFIFRLRSGHQEGSLPTCALFEADGGKWKLEAIQRIKQWLAKELPDMAILA